MNRIGHISPSGPLADTRSRAFTLIELLVTITILAVLMGALVPLIGFANRQAKRSASVAVMAKLDAALRLFRSDIGSYPYQRTYADLAAGAPATNQLYWHLGTAMDSDQTKKIRQDAETAGARYAVAGTPPYDFAFRIASWPITSSLEGIYGDSSARILNRMAAERARLAILAGNVDITGPQPVPHWGPNYYSSNVALTPRVLPSGKLVPAASLAGSAPYGWADSYLAGELEARYRSGTTVLDAWRNPLIYVCQVVEGTFTAPVLGGCTYFNARDWGLQTLGRTTLGSNDALTGRPTGFDLTNLIHSDRRTTAAPKLEAEFELWSAGPDGRADWMRDGSSVPGTANPNLDNVAPLPYDKGIP